MKIFIFGDKIFSIFEKACFRNVIKDNIGLVSLPYVADTITYNSHAQFLSVKGLH